MSGQVESLPLFPFADYNALRAASSVGGAYVGVHREAAGIEVGDGKAGSGLKRLVFAFWSLASPISFIALSIWAIATHHLLFLLLVPILFVVYAISNSMLYDIFRLHFYALQALLGIGVVVSLFNDRPLIAFALIAPIFISFATRRAKRVAIKAVIDKALRDEMYFCRLWNEGFLNLTVPGEGVFSRDRQPSQQQRGD